MEKSQQKEDVLKYENIVVKKCTTVQKQAAKNFSFYDIYKYSAQEHLTMVE